MKVRDAAALLEASKAKVEDASSSLTAAYAAEDAKLVQQRRKELEQAEAEVLDAQHRVNGAELRAQQAKQELDEFTRDNARSFLDECEQTARAVAADLTRKVHEVVKAHKAYTAERQRVDQLVAAVPGASVRADGVPSGYAWQDALRTLERVVGEHPEAELPRPRWLSVSHRSTRMRFTDASSCGGRRERPNWMRLLDAEEVPSPSRQAHRHPSLGFTIGEATHRTREELWLCAEEPT